MKPAPIADFVFLSYLPSSTLYDSKPSILWSFLVSKPTIIFLLQCGFHDTFIISTITYHLINDPTPSYFLHDELVPDLRPRQHHHPSQLHLNTIDPNPSKKQNHVLSFSIFLLHFPLHLPQLLNLVFSPQTFMFLTFVYPYILFLFPESENGSDRLDFGSVI